MKPVVFHPEAEEELFASARYYEACSEGLGLRFLQEVQRGLDAITAAPQRSPVLTGDVRRYLLRPFPFGPLFTELEDRIVLLAVMHLRRAPGCWKPRLKGP